MGRREYMRAYMRAYRAEHSDEMNADDRSRQRNVFRFVAYELTAPAVEALIACLAVHVPRYQHDDRLPRLRALLEHLHR